MENPGVLRQVTYPRTPWKNGRGFTAQIAIEPSGATLQAGNYAWRISLTTVAEAGPFSLFPDYDRTLVLLSGEGMGLEHRDDFGKSTHSVELGSFDVYAFSGGIATEGTPLGGPIDDLNLFHRAGEIGATAEIVRFAARPVWEWTPPTGANFLVAARGAFVVKPADGPAYSLAARDAFRLDVEAGGTAALHRVESESPEAVLVAVRFRKISN